MAPLASIANEIEDALGSGDPARRTAALRRVTTLFIEQAPHLGAPHVDLFDEVILRLARAIEFRARVELAERLADVANAPERVIKDLAYDPDIAVAGPVIERSPQLADDDLITIAATRGQDHLLALSRRGALDACVTDVILDRGEAPVVRSLAGNGGARFSGEGVDLLLARARSDEALRAVLLGRGDLAPDQIVRLVAIARERAREAIRPELQAPAVARLDATLATVAGALAESGEARILLDDYGPATEAVRRRAERGALTEVDIVEWLKAGQLPEAIAALAHLAALPVPIVARAYHAAHFDPLLVIVRSLRFGWSTFKLFLACKVGREPPDAVLKAAFEAYQGLSVGAAAKAVRFTAVRDGVLPAVAWGATA
jgi:uncharacterized protein (DUF2336 family)